jgi:carbon-monoxide dehydrogenase medium subunit
MDIAVAAAAASVRLSHDGSTIRAARIALSTVAATPLLAVEAGASLEGAAASDEAIARAAAIAQTEAHPRTTMRGTAPHRRHLVGVLTERALHAAISRARKG